MAEGAGNLKEGDSRPSRPPHGSGGTKRPTVSPPSHAKPGEPCTDYRIASTVAEEEDEARLLGILLAAPSRSQPRAPIFRSRLL